MPVIVINDTNHLYWKSYMNHTMKFLNLFKCWIDAYVLDFFTKELWQEIPDLWKEFMVNWDGTDIAKLLVAEGKLSSNDVAPLSLLAFKIACSTYALPRAALDDTQQVTNFLNKYKSVKKMETLNKDDSEWKCEGNVFKKHLKNHADQGQTKSLPHIFRIHLNPKKQHEVMRLSYIASLVASAAGIDVLVDIGSGQGHLSRLICYGYEIPTLCLDGEQKFIEEAEKFDKQLEKFVTKNGRNFVLMPNGPKHSNLRVDGSSSDQSIAKVVNSLFPELKNGDCDLSFGLIGLHTCGDLGPLVLQRYLRTKTAKVLISVGCCYMKLSCDSVRSNEFIGYPLSSFVKSNKFRELSYSARELACHSIDAYGTKLKCNADNLKVHCYRAVLEKIISKKDPSLQHVALQSVKNAHSMSFPSYARKSTSKLPLIFTHEDLDSNEITEDLSCWKEVVKFYTLRSLLAPVIETLLLLDRLMYLYEEGTPSIMFPLFDPLLSPRNHVILSIKPS